MREAIVLTSAPDPLDKSQWRRSCSPSVAVGQPFDPRPLMESVRNRISSDHFRFAVLGDTHHSPAFQDIIRLIRAENPDFVISVGDLVDLGGGRESSVNYEKLRREAGEFFRSLPVWTVLGNHDVDSRWDNDIWNGIANFKAFFNLDPYYSFEFRNSKFIFLSWMLPDDAELEFLKRELDGGAHRNIFIIIHYPLFSVADGVFKLAQDRDIELELKALLSRHRVTAVFSGHDHIYYRTRRNDVTYLISGGAGVNSHLLNQLSNAIPGDAHYGRDPSSGKFVLKSPKYDRSWPNQQNFFILMDVSNEMVTGKVISTSPEVLDEFQIP